MTATYGYPCLGGCGRTLASAGGRTLHMKRCPKAEGMPAPVVRKRSRRERPESPELEAASRRFARALAKRAEEGDTEALEGLVALAAEVEAAIGTAARSLHACGYSWTDLAGVLGVSRQAARQRFANQ